MDMTDAIIYEMHIRDFSISDDSGMSNKGEFQALAEEGTTLSGTDISTGVDHLVDLGVTHVQIQPSYDYGSVNELGSDTQYNWAIFGMVLFVFLIELLIVYVIFTAV